MSSIAGLGAVVTGGASGIGKGTTEALLAAGCDVVVADLQEKEGAALAAQHPGRVTFVRCDVTKTADMQRVADAATRLRAGGAAIWFLNAGVNTEGHEDLLTSPGKRWKIMVDINLSAVIEGAQVAYAHMRERDLPGDKFIIATASMAGLLPTAAPVYAATKAAVIQLQRSLAVRLAAAQEHDVWCYTLCPSFTDTPLARGDITVDDGGGIVRGDGGWDEGRKALMAQQIGGILQVSDQVDGVMGLLAQRPPSGAVLRVTMRRRGTLVVHDLVAYGKA